MAALYTSAELIYGNLVLQDEYDKTKFYYFPYEAKGVVSGKDFTGSYWGISYMPYFVGVMATEPTIGCDIRGKAYFDITEEARIGIIKELKEKYSLEKIILSPAQISMGSQYKDTGLQPVLGPVNTQTTPNIVTIGSPFGYTLNSKDIGTISATVGKDSTGLPHATAIGLNVVANWQVRGEPYTAEIKAKKKLVWDYVRSHVNVHATIGWFDISSDWQKITENLSKQREFTFKVKTGTGQDATGLALIASAQKLFESLNSPDSDLMKFDPLPAKLNPTDPKGSSILPFSVSINCQFIDQEYQSTETYEMNMSYEGMYDWLISGYIPLNTTSESSWLNVQTGKHEMLSEVQLKQFNFISIKEKQYRSNVKGALAGAGVALSGFNDFCKDSLLILTEHANLPIPPSLLPQLKDIGFEAYKEACAKQGWPWDEKNKNLSEGIHSLNKKAAIYQEKINSDYSMAYINEINSEQNIDV
ncbi:hypothetical protein [Fluviispira sanaruensis]|uniref:Uncharacterized protein n=1 Tax=Fluviispira sanaruensis TaxID=2493639 RepID=A0A4V0P2J0_FLUSA|nr:hypothetical protein [Fluviispira sanaruensis]BBH53397.1 hypothetical protein JCM31447_18400 [Fluviispira sanaruensis]